ncbi:MAG: hypothetical protein V1929_08660 [bacterium]
MFLNRWRTLFLLTSALCLLAPGAATAATLYVWTNSPNPGFPFNTWSNAARTIQAAVDAAQSNDTVWVTNGVYATGGRPAPGGSLTNRLVVTNAITIASVNGPSNTFIVGKSPRGINAVRCVYMTAGMLSGFTLTNGHTANSAGGARDDVGGGALADGGILSNCVITSCSARQSGGGAAYSELVDCTVSYSEAFLGNGGGLYGCNATRCDIFGNWTIYYYGGGAATSVLVGCTISSNQAVSDNLGRGGGGYACTASNSMFAWNLAEAQGGGVCLGVLYNCTLVGNTCSNHRWRCLRCHVDRL